MAEEEVGNVYETVHLSEMEYEESDDLYFYQCPCGDYFEISTADLTAGKRIANCQSCTLRILVDVPIGKFKEAPPPDGSGAPAAAVPPPPRAGAAANLRPMREEECYAALGLTPTASDAEIKTAYKALARKWHPDINCEPGAKEKFQTINEAYTAITT